MGNTNSSATVTGGQRFPRVLFFTAGMVPTADDYEDISRFRPNASFRNALAVAALPMSPLEECDAVAGPAIPERYARAYPNVNDYNGNMLRMSDLDRPHGAVSSVDNEAARAAKPPSVNEPLTGTQGAPRAAGSMTMAGGGFTAPRPAGGANVGYYGSERAENAATGDNPSNPYGLPDAGITALAPENEGANVVGLSTPTSDGGFTAPPPAATEDAKDETGDTDEATTKSAKNK